MASVVVVGLGYVGLPLAIASALAGHTVIGLDVDPHRVQSLRDGEVDDDLRDDLHTILSGDAAGTLDATGDPSAIADADVVLICAPTGLTNAGRPDLEPLRAAARTVGDHVSTQTLIVLVSTSFPGTTTELLLPEVDRGRFEIGADLWVAVSPERGSPGEPALALATTPRVVGGVTPECGRRAAKFFASFVDDVIPAAGAAEAEMSKLLENAFRLVNLALVNELLPLCRDLGIDLWDAIDCAATKPYGFMPFWPGPGAGGHCIPVDPIYLVEHIRSKLDRPLRSIELAAAINAEAPLYVADRVRALLLAQGTDVSGADVLLLGVSYKADVDDTRETPAATIAATLTGWGAHVHYHDPHVPRWVPARTDPTPERVEDPYTSSADADLTVLLQAHRTYDLQRLTMSANLLLDTRGVLRGSLGTVTL